MRGNTDIAELRNSRPSSRLGRYIHSHFHRRGIPEGKKRNLWVLGLASLLSWGAGDAADWTHDKIAGEQPAVQTSVEASQLVRSVDQIHK